MVVPSPLERQDRQNTNDVLPVYELVHGIDRKISALDVTVSTVVGTQLRHGQRLDVVGQRLDVIDDKLEQVSGQLTETRIEMNAKLEQVLELLRGR